MEFCQLGKGIFERDVIFSFQSREREREGGSNFTVSFFFSAFSVFVVLLNIHFCNTKNKTDLHFFALYEIVIIYLCFNYFPCFLVLMFHRWRHNCSHAPSPGPQEINGWR